MKFVFKSYCYSPEKKPLLNDCYYTKAYYAEQNFDRPFLRFPFLHLFGL